MALVRYFPIDPKLEFIHFQPTFQPTETEAPDA